MRNPCAHIVLIMLISISYCFAEGTTTAPSDLVVYKPPKRGAPSARVGGGSRSGTAEGQKLPNLWVLLPTEVASTTRVHPALYRFVDASTKARFEISLVDLSDFKTIYRSKSDGVETAGIHKLDLAKEKVSLSTDGLYRWRVALVPDPAQKSKDVDSGGTISRIAPPEGLDGQLKGATSHLQKAKAYADASIWCDALSELSDAIEANPNDAALHAMRAALMKQADLSEVGEFETTA